MGALAEDPQFLIAGLRVMPDRWNKESDFRKIEHYSRQAVSQGAQVVITSEGFLDGYVDNDRPLGKDNYFAVAEPIDGPVIKRVRKLARER